MAKKWNDTLSEEDMKMHKLSVQIWRVFFWAVIVFSGVLATGASVSIGVGLIPLTENAVSFLTSILPLLSYTKT